MLGQDVGRSTLYAIAGGFLIAFIAIGWFISRDARNTLPADRRDPKPAEHLSPAERRKREKHRAARPPEDEGAEGRAQGAPETLDREGGGGSIPCARIAASSTELTVSTTFTRAHCF